MKYKLNKKVLGIFLMLILIMSCGKKGAAEPAKDIPLVSADVVEGKLENGLKYYIYPTDIEPELATLHLVVGAGSLMEKNGQEGTAHFLEHMAFNGTTKYPKNELVTFLDEHGLKFGADLNAHTSFDETVYKLNVSTKNEDKFLETFEVLREWATEITLDEEEIEKEVGVILGEWRLSQGLRGRLNEQIKKSILGESHYSDRFPIGEKEVIENMDYELLNDFYTTWYQPSNMAIIVVGDVDVEFVKGEIEKKFDFENTSTLPEIESYPLEEVLGRVDIFTDEEIETSSINVFIRGEEISGIKTERQVEDTLIRGLYFEILNSRYEEASRVEGTDLLGGAVLDYPISSTEVTYLYGALDDEAGGTKEVLNQFKSIAEYGITETELENFKNITLASYKNLVGNKSYINNSHIANELRKTYFLGETYLDLEDEIKLIERLYNNIDVDDINGYAKELYENNDITYLLITNKDIASEEIESAVNTVKDAKETPDYRPKELNLKLKTAKLEKAKVIEESKKDDYTYYELANGSEIYIKDTDFEPGKIRIKIIDKGGASSLSEKEYINSKFLNTVLASNLGNLTPQGSELYIRSKGIKLSQEIDYYTHETNIFTKTEEFADALEVYWNFIDKPQVDEAILANNLTNMKLDIENRERSPIRNFRKRLIEVLDPGNKNKHELELNDLESVDKATIESTFEKLFSEQKEQKIFIVGDLEGIDILDSLSTYIGNIEVKDKLERKYSTLPKGKIQEEVIDGEDEKSVTTIIYPYYGVVDYRNIIIAKAFSDVLTKHLIEVVREELGATYSIHSGINISPLNEGEDYLRISYTTKPSDRAIVSGVVHQVLQDVIGTDYSPTKKVGEEFDQDKLSGIIENYKVEHESSLENNNYWMSVLINYAYFGEKNTPLDPTEYGKVVSETNLDIFTDDAFDLNNYIEVRLAPEK